MHALNVSAGSRPGDVRSYSRLNGDAIRASVIRASVCIGSVVILLAGCHGSTTRAPEYVYEPRPDRWLILAKEYGANIEWIDQVRAAAKKSPLLTSSLQREWLAGRPILFPGVLVDVVSSGAGRYLLQIRAPEFYMNTELQDQFLALQLECAASEIEPLLPSSARLTDRLSVAPLLTVVAKISRVETRKVMVSGTTVEAVDDVDDFGRSGMRMYESEPDTLKEWKVGFGECVHLEAVPPPKGGA